MILTFLLAGLLVYPSVNSYADSLQAQVVIIKMDSLEVLPLPVISGLIPGNTPVDIFFDEATLNLEQNIICLKGQVVDHHDKLEIPGVRVAIGTYDTTSSEFTSFIPRISKMTDYRGEFAINTKIKKSDIFTIVWLGHLEKVYSFRKMFE